MKKMLSLLVLVGLGIAIESEARCNCKPRPRPINKTTAVQGADSEKSSCCNTCNTCTSSTNCGCGCCNKQVAPEEVKTSVANVSADANCGCSGKPNKPNPRR